MRRASELGLGPKVTQAILALSRMLDEVALLLDPDRPEGAPPWATW